MQTLEHDDLLLACRDRTSEEGLGELAGLHLNLELLSLQPLLRKDLVDGNVRRAAARLPEIRNARIQGPQAILLLALG